MADDVIYKHNLAQPSYLVDFTRKLTGDTSLASAAVSSIAKSDGVALTVSDLTDTVTVSGMVATIPFKAFGVNGEDYRLTITGTGTTTAKVATFILEARLRNSMAGVV